MTPNRWHVLTTLLTLAVVGTRGAAQAPECTSSYMPVALGCGMDKEADGKMVPRTYPIAGLVQSYGEQPHGIDLLIKTVTHVVQPKSWTDQGGQGTIVYFPLGRSLVVQQTPEVHMQVACLLRSLEKMWFEQQAAMHGVPRPYNAWHVMQPPMPLCPLAQVSCTSPVACAAPCAPAPMPTPVCCTCPAPSTVKTPQAKQYVHFLIKDVEFKTEENVTFKLGKVSFMYKGDGIEADVAKAALGVTGSDDKSDAGTADMTKCLNEVAKCMAELAKSVSAGTVKKDKCETDSCDCPCCEPVPAPKCDEQSEEKASDEDAKDAQPTEEKADSDKDEDKPGEKTDPSQGVTFSIREALERAGLWPKATTSSQDFGIEFGPFN